MSGLKSRRKGRAYEYEVRDYLRELGYEAKRVPLSGASQGYKDDIDFSDSGGFRGTIEAKRRKSDFKNIYTMYEAVGEPVLAVSDGKTLFWITQHFNLIHRPTTYIYAKDMLEYYTTYKRACNKIRSLTKISKTANYLALRDDNKYTLFVRIF